jgi:hypothetical protein
VLTLTAIRLLLLNREDCLLADAAVLCGAVARSIIFTSADCASSSWGESS